MARPQVINRERVAHVALALLDSDGPDALSLERIAKQLGVRGPSLYYYYRDKHDILREVASLVVGDLDLDRDTSDWQQWMIDAGLTLYSRVKDHPNAAALLIEFMPERAAMSGFGRGARLLADAGVDPALHVLLMEGSQKLVWGFTLQQAIDSRGTGPADDGQWPELATARRANHLDDEQLLELALRSFINGVLAMEEMR